MARRIDSFSSAMARNVLVVEYIVCCDRPSPRPRTRGLLDLKGRDRLEVLT